MATINASVRSIGTGSLSGNAFVRTRVDYFFRWADEATAKSQALALGEHFGIEITPGVIEWARDRVIPNVKAWRPSQDIIVDGRVTHNYLSGWFAIVSLNRHVDILMSAAALQFALNRNACNNGYPFVIKNNIGAVISDVACEPIFVGSNYPMGGYT